MPRYGLTALIVACAVFMETLDGTVISTSLPAIAADLHQDPITLKLALTSYLLSLAIFIPASGWAADRFGARTVFRIAILVFTFGSILCGLSSTLPEFVGARMVQGMGGAMMVPVGRLVLLRSVDRSEMVPALAYLMIPALLGPIAGPPIGGFITTYLHWRWIFFVNVPIGALGIGLVSLFIKNIRAEEVWPLDVKGFLLLGSGLASLVFGVTVIGRGLVSMPVVIGLIGAGALFLTAYALHARKAAFPILDLRLLAIPTFRASILGGSLFRIGVGALPLLLPLMLQIGFGMNAFQSGSVTFVASAGAMLMKATAMPLLRLFGFRRILIFDALLSAGFFAGYGFFTPATPIILMMGLLLVGGFIRSLEFTSLNAIAYAEIDGAAMSRATSFSAVAQQLSLSLGIAVGAFVIDMARDARGAAELTAADFRWAFVVVAVISASSIVSFLRLPADAGTSLVGERRETVKA
ncbi:MAG: MFS transporter [Methylovirgula sp.]